jgi:hypothetical protein
MCSCLVHPTREDKNMKKASSSFVSSNKLFSEFYKFEDGALVKLNNPGIIQRGVNCNDFAIRCYIRVLNWSSHAFDELPGAGAIFRGHVIRLHYWKVVG